MIYIQHKDTPSYARGDTGDSPEDITSPHSEQENQKKECP